MTTIPLVTTVWWALLRGQTDLVHISDTHIAQLDGVRPELAQARALHRESLAKLERFVSVANGMTTMTLVHTGDVVDATCFDGASLREVKGQIEAVTAALARLRHPYHLALGNHDVECYRYDAAKPATPRGDQTIAQRARKDWRRQIAGLRNGTYYSSLVAPGYRLFVLDNGQALDVRGGREFWTKQMRWLRRELQKRPERAVIALHIPVAADERSELLKAELRRSERVALILCGHRHTHAVDWLDLGSRKVLQVRTGALFQGADAWRRLRLWSDRVEVSAPGEPGRVMETVRW